jgi:hypothetical protein
MLEPTTVHLEHPGRPFGQTSSPPGSRSDPTRRLSAAPISSPWLQTTVSSAAGSNSRATSVGGIDPENLRSLDWETAAPGERLDGLQTAHRGAAQDPGDPVVAQLDEQALGLPPAGADRGRSRSGPIQARLSPAWA